MRRYEWGGDEEDLGKERGERAKDKGGGRRGREKSMEEDFFDLLVIY